MTSAFTVDGPEQMNSLPSPCWVKLAGAPDEAFKEFGALWDTGATSSAITGAVVAECGLKPVGRVKVFHAGIEDEPDETDAYVVDIGLPNRVVVPGVRVSRSGFKGGDVLIGMDIITAGDFAITHPNGKTQFTFQTPSQADIDFVKQQPPRNRQERRAMQRKDHKDQPKKKRR